MNMQAMLKQAQKLQRDMLKTQEEINNTEYTGKSSLVTVVMNGKREVLSIKIDSQELASDDIEMLEDMILVAFNDALKQVEKDTEEKMGAYTKGVPGMNGLF